MGFLIKEGKENKMLAELWSKLPKEESKEALKLAHPLDLVNLLPQEKKTYRYNGSLTTPPCSEGVKWLVLAQPIEMSKEQINAFAAINEIVPPINGSRAPKIWSPHRFIRQCLLFLKRWEKTPMLQYCEGL
ncbi:MAG TPA: carbonic anhydrase family protein [Candidatus Bathyarchaeia archaeon]|nr:carbonic anhydrase family protein [Candidatus Bathyarchaeia archaeon]